MVALSRLVVLQSKTGNAYQCAARAGISIRFDLGFVARNRFRSRRSSARSISRAGSAAARDCHRNPVMSISKFERRESYRSTDQSGDDRVLRDCPIRINSALAERIADETCGHAYDCASRCPVDRAAASAKTVFIGSCLFHFAVSGPTALPGDSESIYVARPNCANRAGTARFESGEKADLR